MMEALHNLTSIEIDAIVSGIQEIRGTEFSVDIIEEQLHNVVSEINTVNREREMMTTKKEKIKAALDALKKVLYPSIQLQLFCEFLMLRYNEIADKIVDMKPVSLLHEKHRLNRKREEIMRWENLSDMLQMEITNGRRN